MRLYVVQHGESIPKEVDPERRLSEKGIEVVTRLARTLQLSGVSVARVLHSGKARASQTAMLLAAKIAPRIPAQTVSGITPMDSTDSFIRRLGDWTDDILVVSHQPFAGKLVSCLLCGHDETVSTAFLPGSIVCLERGADNSWCFLWMIRPELLVV